VMAPRLGENRVDARRRGFQGGRGHERECPRFSGSSWRSSPSQGS
jgi:hypothetical protein